MKFISEIKWWWRVFTTPGKSRLEAEIDIVQFLAQRGEMTANDLYDALNEGFDFDNPTPHIYVSFGMIYVIMADLEESGVVRSRLIESDGRKRMVWRLTGRGPRKRVIPTRLSFQSQISGA